MNLALAEPQITQLLVLSGPTVYPFSIPVRSEDVGERVWFALHSTYALGAAQSDRIFDPRVSEPSHLNDVREITFPPISGAGSLLSADVARLPRAASRRRSGFATKT